MINKPYAPPITSTMTVHRMRYRGPIESHKMNKLNQDSVKDIHILEEHFDSSYNTLRNYIQETHTGCDKKIVVGENGVARFNGVCSVTNDILNNKNNNLMKNSKGVN